MLSDPTLIALLVKHTYIILHIYILSVIASIEGLRCFWGWVGGNNVRWTDDTRFAVLRRMSEDDPLVLSLVLVLLIRLSGRFSC